MTSPSTPLVCPHCSRATATPFGTTGLCLFCAGQRALALDLGSDEPEETGDRTPPASLAAFPGLPARIGPYEVIDEIGRGGMARVFAARQPRLDRLVALKVLAAGAAHTDLAQRFLREAQTVAGLRHPNIIALHDSGRADGCIYFAMDYIEGGDLAARLQTGRPGPAEAASLVRRVALALAYAHRAGVLHRDIKPSNILLQGDEPVLADFGLAALIEPGGDLTRATAVLGTPHYLAPEAVRGGSAAMTPAADLYALGVVLYEMLAGRTPFAGTTPVELAARLQDTEPPPVRRFAPATPRDLETICLKCLERDPARRYAGAEALAEDLRRHLDGEAILARPLPPVARFFRWARRRPVLAALWFAVLLLAVGATTAAFRINRERLRADAEAARAETSLRQATAVVDFLKDDLLAQASPTAHPDRELKLRIVLKAAADKIDGRFPDQPLVEAALRETIGATYQSLGEYASASTQLDRALALRRRTAPATPAEWRLMNQLGESLTAQGRYREAAALVAAALLAQRRTLGAEHPDTVESTATLAGIYHRQDKLVLAEHLERGVLNMRLARLGPAAPGTLAAMSHLATTLMDLGKFEEGTKLLHAVFESRRHTLAANHPATLQAGNDLALAYWAQQRYTDAEPLLRETLTACRSVLGPDHPQTLDVMSNLATLLREQKQWDEAAGLYEAVLTGWRQTVGYEHHEVLRNLSFLALVHRSQGRLAEAQARLEEARGIGFRVLGAKHPEVLSVGDLLGSVLLAQGKFAEAEPILRESLAGHLEGDNRPGAVDITRCRLGASLAGQHQLAEAERLMLTGYDGLRHDFARLMPYQQGVLRETALRLAELYIVTNRPELAQTWRTKAEAPATPSR